MNSKTLMLRQAPYVSPRIGGLIGWSFILFFFVVLKGQWRFPHTGDSLWLTTLILMGPLAAALLVYLLRRSRDGQEIEFQQKFIRLPRRWGSSVLDEIPYESLRTFGTVGSSRALSLYFETVRRTYSYPLRAFAHVPSPEFVEEQILSRLEDSPAKLQHKKRLIQANRFTALCLESNPIGTWLFLASIAAAYFVQILLVSPDNEVGIISLGANSGFLIQQGQIWRLISSNLLHGGWLHIAFNGLAILVLGPLLERSIGTHRLWIVLAISCVAGAATSSLIDSHSLSLGCSTGVFGLLGALAFMNWRHRAALPAFCRLRKTWWIPVLGLNAALPLLVPQIDYAAHIGGFVAGALIAIVMLRTKPSLGPQVTQTPIVKIVAIGLLAIFIAGVAAAGVNVVSGDRSDERAVVRAILTDENSSPGLLNNMSWIIVTGEFPVPQNERAQWLSLSLDATRRAIAEIPDCYECYDTLSHIHAELGDVDAAMKAEEQAIDMAPDEIKEKFEPWLEILNLKRNRTAD